MSELKPTCCRSRPCKHPGVGPCDLPYVSPETLHDAEDADALHLNLDREGVPRADEAGAVYSLWGRVLRFAERRTPQPVTPAMVERLEATIDRMEEMDAKHQERMRRLGEPVTPAGGEVELTREHCRAMIWTYELMMGGVRLPDGEGYDFEVVQAMYAAALNPVAADNATEYHIPPTAHVALSNAYDVGWIECTNWAKRDDLVSDMDSPAYAEDRARNLAALNQRGG